nr:hypothetical protein [Tanacetum cinerariifolium]
QFTFMAASPQKRNEGLLEPERTPGTSHSATSWISSSLAHCLQRLKICR